MRCCLCGCKIYKCREREREREEERDFHLSLNLFDSQHCQNSATPFGVFLLEACVNKVDSIMRVCVRMRVFKRTIRATIFNRDLVTRITT